MPQFGFGPQSTLAPLGGESMVPMGTHYVGTLAPPPGSERLMPGGPQSFDQNGAPPAPATPWQPSKWDIFSEAMGGDGSLHHAAERLRAEHTSHLFAQDDAAAMQAALAGKSPDAAFALHHDPSSFSTNVNANYAPHAVAGGSTGFGFGKNLGVAPVVGMNPQGVGYAQDDTQTVQTGRVATPQTRDEAVKAANAAEETRLKAMIAPAQILHFDRTGQAALIAARKQPAGGGVKPGAPKPTGRVF